MKVKKYYYVLCIPVLKKTCFEIIGFPKSKTLQDSKEFSRYIIRGEMDKETFDFSFFIKEVKRVSFLLVKRNVIQDFLFIPLN